MTRNLSVFLFALFCGFAFISCGRQDNSLDRILLQERDSLQTLATANQIELERMTSFFNEVAACIDSINEQESLLVTQVDAETHHRYTQQEIAQRLNQLSDIILNQRARINTLLDSLNNGVDTLRTSGLRNTISFLTAQLAQKEEQINRLQAEIQGHQRNIRNLNNRVSNLTEEVQQLSTQNEQLTEAVQIQTEIINEGYVLVATKQELKDMGVIEGGGFLKRSKVNINNIDLSLCNKVNIAVFDQLSLPSRNAKILTPAPNSSYRIISQNSSSILRITNGNAFWSLSNILVIQI